MLGGRRIFDSTARSGPKGKGSGLGDLSIVEEWKLLCGRFRTRRVYVWSLDHGLASYDHLP